MKGQNIINCPQCGSNKIKKSQLSSFMLILAVLCSFTVIGIPLGIGFFVAWLIMRKKDKLTFICQECKRQFRVSEEKLDQYNSYVKDNEAVLK